MGPTAVFTCFVLDEGPPNTVLWGPDLILSRRPFWRLAHIKKEGALGRGPGRSKNKSGTKLPFFVRRS